ncbi:Nitrilotriacetate monooxygenase component B [Actinosynnema pretiosum subsp. pretiosum]|nr:Nitrilotriacetate monooxygenase component B [Actinosynnema pretiosum subsp. pretiosum]
MSAYVRGAMSTIDRARFRQVMGHVPTGVVVITSQDPGGRPVGLACNSFTSVSLDPPLVLFCAAGGSSTLPALRAAGAFRVNVLEAGQESLCRRFATRGVDRFAGVDWTPAHGGPRLAGAVAGMDCAVLEEHAAGDHVIVVGRVLRLAETTGGAPLVFHRGRYGSFAVGADLLG